MDMQMKDLRVLITAGANGIGKATALAFRALGTRALAARLTGLRAADFLVVRLAAAFFAVPAGLRRAWLAFFLAMARGPFDRLALTESR